MFRYRKILVPLDGSEPAEKALLPAMRIAKAMDSELIFLQVVSGSALDLRARFNHQIIKARNVAAGHYFESINLRFSDTERSFQTEITTGAPSKRILDYATRLDVDLLVLHSCGRTGLDRWINRNVASKIILHPPCDTLVLRTPGTAIDSLGTKRVMVPLDGSRLAERTLTPAISLASSLGMEVILVSFSSSIYVDLDPASRPIKSEELEEKERNGLHNYLLEIQTSFNRHNVPISIYAAKRPRVSTIIDNMRKQNIELIVMSSHGDNNNGNWLIGSTLKEALRKAGCSTLVVRPGGLH